MSTLATRSRTLTQAQLQEVARRIHARVQQRSGPLAQRCAPGKPWLRVRQSGKYTDVHLVVPVSPGQCQTFSVRVDNDMVRRWLMRHVVQVGFSLGGIWRAVKKVAKATGISSVLKVASKALDNPIIKSVVPVAGIVGPALKAGRALLGAQMAAGRGDPRAKKLVLAAQTIARQRRDHPVAQGHAIATRAYRIIVSPA